MSSKLYIFAKNTSRRSQNGILRDGKEMERNSLKEGGVKKVRNLSNYAM